MKEDYTILDAENLLSLIEKEKALYEYQIPDNMASVFKFPDGKIAVFPAINTSYGVLFRNKEAFNSTLENKGIPIKETNLSPFQKEITRILEIDKSALDIIHELNTLYNQNMIITLNKNRLKEVSFSLRELLKELNYEYIYEELYFRLGIYIHLLIKNLIDGNWDLDKRYGINPYWVPYIVDKSGVKYRAWKGILDSLERPNHFEIEKCIRLTITEPASKKLIF